MRHVKHSGVEISIGDLTPMELRQEDPSVGSLHPQEKRIRALENMVGRLDERVKLLERPWWVKLKHWLQGWLRGLF